MSLTMLQEYHRGLTPASSQTPAFSTLESGHGFLEIRKFLLWEQRKISFRLWFSKTQQAVVFARCCVQDRQGSYQDRIVCSVLKVTGGETFPKTTPAYSEQAEQRDLPELCLISHLGTKPRWRIQSRTIRIDLCILVCEHPSRRQQQQGCPGSLWKAQLFCWKTKGLLLCKTQEAGASHLVALDSTFQEPSISASLSVCLSVRLSPVNTSKQASKFLSGCQGTDGQRCRQVTQTFGLQLSGGNRNKWSREKQPSLLGGKLLLLWTWLTLWGHWKSTVMGNGQLCWQISHLRPSTPAPESPIPCPLPALPLTQLLIPAPACFSRGATKPCRLSRE